MIIDFLLLVFSVFGFYIGYSKGIIKSIVSILSISLGIVAALRLSPTITDFLKDTFDERGPLMLVAGVILTFLLTMTVLRILGRGLEGMLKAANINFINQVLGGALMAAVIVFLYSAVLWFVVQVAYRNPSENPAILESQTYPFLKEYPRLVTNSLTKLKPIFQDFWDYTMDIMDEMETMSEGTEEETQIYDLPEESYDASRPE